MRLRIILSFHAVCVSLIFEIAKFIERLIINLITKATHVMLFLDRFYPTPYIEVFFGIFEAAWHPIGSWAYLVS